MKYIDDQLHVVSQNALLRFNTDLSSCETVCSLSDFLSAQAIITSFTGAVANNSYAISAIVSGKPKTLVVNNGKPGVIPDMLCSALAMINDELFLCTSPYNEFRISGANLTRKQPAKAKLEAEPNEIVKALHILAKLGLLVAFTSTGRVLVFDLFTLQELVQLKTGAMVAIAAETAQGLVYI